MPETLPENQLAIRIFNDSQALGWQAAMDLNDLELTEDERDDLLSKLRFVHAELAALERKRVEEQARKNRGGR